MAAEARFELKYRLGVHEYHKARNALRAFIVPDLYTRKAESGKYLVRSLYFDTADYQAYNEKMTGEYGRIKLRLRTYSCSRKARPPIRVELKTRRGELIEKHSAFVTPEDYDAFMATRNWPDASEPVLAEFARLLHLRALRPKVLVEYQREAFLSRFGDDARITFDHDVRCGSATELFPQRLVCRRTNRHVVVMEVKCRNERPPWLLRAITMCGMKSVPNSKYAQSIERTQPVCWSNWSGLRT